MLPDQAEPLPVGHGQGDGGQDNDNMEEGKVYDLPVAEHLSLCPMISQLLGLKPVEGIPEFLDEVRERGRSEGEKKGQEGNRP